MCKHVLQSPYKWVLVDDPQAQAHVSSVDVASDVHHG